MPTLALHGKSALVTGGARRIGRAIALELARAGADLTITFRESESDAKQTVQQIEALGRRAQAVYCDVRSEASVRAAIAATAAFHGHIDILVNNAAVYASVPLDQITLEQWDTVFETNTRGPFLVAREALAASARGPRQNRQYRFAGRHTRVGGSTGTTARQRPRCTCSRRPWPRPSLPKSV